MASVHRPGWVPRYRLHKRSGLAYIGLAGRNIFLGRHGSEPSRAEYHRLVGEWLVGGGHIAAPGPGGSAEHDHC